MTSEPAQAHDPRDPRAHRKPWRRALAWFLAGALMGPLSVLAHELAHFIVGWWFAFPDLELHAGSVGSSATSRGFPEWQLGLMAIAGPLCTITLAGAACAAALWRPGALFISLALVNLVRPIAMAVRYAVHRAIPGTIDSASPTPPPGPRPLFPGALAEAPARPAGLDNLSDETVAAHHLDLPQWLFIAAGLIVALALSWLLLSKTRGWWTVPGVLVMGAGAVVGFLAYAHVVFPWLTG